MILIKILGVVSFFLVTFGNSLILGIIHYEKYGQDSKKRSFADQIFTSSCLIFLICSYVNDILLEIRSIFGPIGIGPSMLIYYLRSTMLAIPLGIQLFTLLTADFCQEINRCFESNKCPNGSMPGKSNKTNTNLLFF